MNAAYGSTRVLIGRRGDGAGIQDDDFGFDGSAGALQSTAKQLALDSGAIGLGRAASEVLNMISRHQGIILGWFLEAGSASDLVASWGMERATEIIHSNQAAGICITPAAHR